MDYKEGNAELTESLVKQFELNGIGPGVNERHMQVVEIVNRFADPTKPLLEVGARVGHLFDRLKKMGFTDMYGVDVSPYAIDLLLKKGYKGHVGDAQALDFHEEFNTAIMSHTLEHCPEPQLVIECIYESLQPGGIFYVEVPAQKKEPVPTIWMHYYCFTSFDELDSMFDDRWKLLYREEGTIKCVYQKEVVC